MFKGNSMEKEVFSTKSVRKIGHLNPEKWTLTEPHNLQKKLTEKWFIGLNAKNKIISLLEENIGENLCGQRLSRYFLGMTTKAQSIKEKLENLNFLIKV